MPRSATPTLSFAIAVSDASGIPIQFIALSVLITIEPGQRAYDAENRERLVELFGEPERWGSTTGASAGPRSTTSCRASPARRTSRSASSARYDHEIAATKFFGGLDEGVFPLHFHFNGTVHYEGADGRLQILPLAWDRSARFELPVATWREMIDSPLPAGSLAPVSATRRCGASAAARPRPARRPSTTASAACSELAGPRTGRTATMQEAAERLAASLLYEGYALYPYTPGATKNATPTPFGIVYPPAYAAAPAGRLRPSPDRVRRARSAAEPTGFEAEAALPAGGGRPPQGGRAPDRRRADRR